ncbi:uL14 family ribosomal protein [Candidatus Woesearchaeota archaeon]|nr:large subunit ribosomal protein L14 [uncultured archaeon]KHO47197.1 MAG: large subunit ribosomal protein L14 [archaeon GW2011_AR4]MBS3129182.1 uL14 family ribosomal protein [Candidatus Woesearchaeota archaeon]HIH37915.1 50S ribosomal protein L14 [Candidatus Woesearchaeota archaeon]HIH48876.1 50S ribosomal protein L14 [Candidatus Woesearchaeota archaeon]
MQAIKARITNGLNHGSVIVACDNSGAKALRIISFKGSKTVKGRKPSGGVGALIMASVVKGQPGMRKKVVPAIIVRQKKEYRRADGTRISFEDNAAIVLKDEKGNPKGTIFKGPFAKEACVRWPPIAKVAKIVV